MAKNIQKGVVLDTTASGFDAGVISDNQNALAARREIVMEKLGDSQPYDQSLVIEKTRFHLSQSAESLLEAGKNLIILKECEPHGNFLLILNSRLGLPERTAQKMMQAATKYLSPKLQSKTPALLAIGKAKLFELLTEDDDELAELADGGTVAGVTLDEIDRMSVRELRQALRKSKEATEDKEKLLVTKGKTIDTLQTDLEKASRRIKTTTPDDEGFELSLEARGIANSILSQIRCDFEPAMQALQEFEQRTGIDQYALKCCMAIEIVRAMNYLVESHGLDLTIDTDNTPEWQREGADEIIAANVAKGRTAAIAQGSVG